jgi:hypothetical protein
MFRGTKLSEAKSRRSESNDSNAGHNHLMKKSIFRIPKRKEIIEVIIK